MKILLAVDGSRQSLKTVKHLIASAGWYRESLQVELIYVHLPVPKLPRMKWAVSARQIREYYEKDGWAALSKARKLLGASGIRYAARILVGPIAETIVKEAVRTRSDLIMIGTRGMTAAANLLLGSIATRVLHLSSVPVLLVK
jgi:nucleotide-binding universal stress UspA family protein